MAAVWFCEPAVGRLGTDRTGSILKNHRSYRLDAVFPYGNDVSRNLHRIDPEDDRTGENVAAGQATFLVDGLQLIVAILLMVLGVMVAYSCIRKLFGAGKIQKKRQRNTAEK